MSDSQGYEEIVLSSDGVNVVKRFEENEFPVPAIAFEFTSNRDEDVNIALSDTVPEDIEVEDLGFHPEYGSEYWVIDDDSIVFERDLEPGETYTTVYGIRATGSDNVEKFLTEPTLESVDPPLPDDASENVVPESDGDVIKEAISGDGEIPGLEEEDEEDEDEDEDVAKLDLKDPNDSATDNGADDTATAPAVEGGVVAAMAAEIRQQNVSTEDLKLLRQAFAAVEEEGATAAKVEQIQDDVADLRAYTGALEEFLDENGTAQQILDEFEGQLESFESRLSSVQSSTDDNAEQVAAVAETVTGFEDDIAALDDDVVAVREEMDSLADEVETVSTDVDEATDKMDSVDEELSEFDATLESIQSDIEELEAAVDDGDMAQRLDDIEQSIDDLQTWQEQIKSTFGG
ncbi:Sec34-like family protein [Halovenus aranensis]|jgi:methyl-accepting chemotaxis protein|uniref:Sec34-like family protein n=1 Tax=Halovenus aranensis TaxID=890420 RepID=A0A1G8TRS3_9EURY|nr:hypothetical protein [Halovenus aranensis]SDJ44137.1 Sec34-like family protein [Halovenus aranensis]